MMSGRLCLKCELICRLQELAQMTQAEKDATDADWATPKVVKLDAKRQNKAGRMAWGRFLRCLRYHCASGLGFMGVATVR